MNDRLRNVNRTKKYDWNRPKNISSVRVQVCAKKLLCFLLDPRVVRVQVLFKSRQDIGVTLNFMQYRRYYWVYFSISYFYKFLVHVFGYIFGLQEKNLDFRNVFQLFRYFCVFLDIQIFLIFWVLDIFGFSNTLMYFGSFLDPKYPNPVHNQNLPILTCIQFCDPD